MRGFINTSNFLLKVMYAYLFVNDESCWLLWTDFTCVVRSYMFEGHPLLGPIIEKCLFFPIPPDLMGSTLPGGPKNPRGIGRLGPIESLLLIPLNSNFKPVLLWRNR